MHVIYKLQGYRDIRGVSDFIGQTLEHVLPPGTKLQSYNGRIPKLLSSRSQVPGPQQFDILPFRNSGEQRSQLFCLQHYDTMALPRALLQYICGLVLLIASVNALKFDLQARGPNDAKKERCIRNFVAKDTLVVVTATVGGSKGDGMIVNIHVRSTNTHHIYIYTVHTLW